MSTTASSNLSSKRLFFWILQFCLPAALFLIPTNDLFTGQMRLFCVITLFAIIAFATETFQQTFIAFLLPIAYLISGVCDAATAFSSWAGFVPWTCIGGLFFVAVLNRIGLLQRISYKVIILTGGTYPGIIISMGILGLLFNLIMPGNVFIILGAFAFGLIKALEVEDPKLSAGIMFAAAIGAGVPTCFVLTTGQFIMFDIGEAIGALETPSWITYFFQQAPAGLVFYIVTLIITYFLFRPQKKLNSKEFCLNQIAKLGPMTRDEKKALIVLITLIVAVMTEKIHGVSAGWCLASIPIFAFCPGINIAKKEDFQSVNFSLVIFLASCVSIGAAATACNFGSFIGTVSMPMLEGQSITIVILATWLIGVIANFFMTPLSIWSTFAAPFTEIATNLGIDPSVLYQALIYAGDQVILPYENTFYLIIFSFGLLSMKDFAKGFGIKMIVNLIWLAVIAIPYWNLIGIL